MFKYSGIILLLLSFSLPAQANIYRGAYGSRSYAMGGALRALVGSNDNVGVNPASIALKKRYGIEGLYNFQAKEELSLFSISIEDSKSGPLSAGLRYSYTGGDAYGFKPSFHRLDFDLAMMIGEYFAFGLGYRQLNGKYLENSSEVKNNLYNMSAGISLALGEYITFAFSYENIIPDKNPDFFPSLFGVGFGITYKDFTLATDMTVDFSKYNAQDADFDPFDFHLGLEYYIASMVPIRAGYQWARKQDIGLEPTKAHILSAGLGYRGESFEIDAAYQHALEDLKDWALMLNLNLAV